MADRDKIFSWVLYFSVAVVLVILALQKVHDTDVWLHLGIGKYMVEHRALPPGDIFTYTGYGKPYEYFEWLFQVLLYLLYQAAGYNGLMIFKLGLWLLTMGILWQWMKTEGVESRWAAFFTLFPAYLLAARWRERPEVIGYFFLAFYLLAWSRYRQGRGSYLYLLPLVQIIWINLHPSALLGIIVLAVILAGEVLDYFREKDREHLQAMKTLALIIPLLLLVSLINPYNYKSVMIPVMYSTSQAYKNLLIEWKPLWYFSRLHYIYLAFLIPAALSFLPRFRSPRENLKTADLLFFALGAALPYVSARYLAIFALVSLPLAGKNFYWFFSRQETPLRWITSWRQKLPSFPWSLPVIILLLGGILFWLSPKRNVFGWGPSSYAVPRQAMAFIEQNRLPGRIFNQYAWGGYIILEGYPRYPAYIDGRALDLDIFQEYDYILLGRPGWEKKLENRGVNLIMIRSLSPDRGRLVNLIPQLLQNPDWLLIWSQDSVLVFLKNSPENQYWTQRLALPKGRVLEEIIREGRYMIENQNIIQDTYGSLAWAYMNRGNFAEARAAYYQHLRLNPQDQAARNNLQMLEQGRY